MGNVPWFSLPTTTLVFRRANEERIAKPILHYGPLATNQVAGGTDELWVLTIHGSDIQLIPQSAAINGETSVWKLALWGTPRDASALDRLRQLYPLTLEEFCEQRGWGKKMPRQGAELRDFTRAKKREDGNPRETLVYCRELEGRKRFSPEKFNEFIKTGLHFSIPDESLEPIPHNECYIRKRGGMSGLAINKPPHLMISATWKNYLLYSEDYFAVPARQMAISAPSTDSGNTLRALTVFLASSLADYFIFFQTPEWGVYSDFPHVATRVIRGVPTPEFTDEHVNSLAELHRSLLRRESTFCLTSDDTASSKQRAIDKGVFDALSVPEDIRVLVKDFRDNRLPLDKGVSAPSRLGMPPNRKELQAYGRALRDELERFLLGEARPCVRIVTATDLICCEVRLLPNGRSVPQAIEVGNGDANLQERAFLRRLRKRLSEQFSQWAYVDRSLRVFDRDTVQLFKCPRRMDWTRTQALNDADSIISEILANGEKPA